MNPPDQPLEALDPDAAAATEARLTAYAAAMAGMPEGEVMDREWDEHESACDARPSSTPPPYPPLSESDLRLLATSARDTADAVLALHEEQARAERTGAPVDAAALTSATAQAATRLLDSALAAADPAGYYLPALPKQERDLDVLDERLRAWAREVTEMADGEKAGAE